MAKPVFIIGAPRSGTTLLRLMLCNHSHLRGPHEFPLVEIALQFFSTRGAGEVESFLDLLYANHRFVSWGLPRDRLSLRLRESGSNSAREIVAVIFEFYCEEKGGQFYVDKNIGALSILPQILALFPDARFVHLIRDGRDVALSLRERPWAYYRLAPFPKRPLTHLAGGGQLWLDALALADGFERTYAPRLLRVRYEDLVQDAHSELSRVCAFLDVDFEPAMLDYYKRRDATISDENMRANHMMLLEQVTRERTSRYLKALSFSELGLLNELLGPELRANGYPVEPQPGWRRTPAWIFRVRSGLTIASLFFRSTLRRLRAHGSRS